MESTPEAVVKLPSLEEITRNNCVTLIARKCDDCGSGELVTRFTIQTEDGEVLEEGWRCRGCHVTFGLACFGLGPDD